MSIWPFSQRSSFILPLNTADAAIIANVHAQSFYHSWDEASFENFLADPQVIGFGAQASRYKHAFTGFILARLIGDEAEILTFAVTPKQRRAGIGRKLLEHLLRFLYKERANVLFLEVDENNTPAIVLYRRLGFIETGRRKAYYQAVPQVGAKISHNQTNKGNNKRSDAILFEYRYNKPTSV